MSATPHVVGGTDRVLRVVYCGFPDPETARRVGDAAVDLRLAACVNQFPVESIYHWKGKVERAREVVGLFKTTPRKLGALFEFLAREHPYEVPDIFELPAACVHRPYLDYLAATLEPGLGRPATRRGSPRGPGARGPRRTRGRRRPRSRRTGRRR